MVFLLSYLTAPSLHYLKVCALLRGYRMLFKMWSKVSSLYPRVSQLGHCWFSRLEFSFFGEEGVNPVHCGWFTRIPDLYLKLHPPSCHNQNVSSCPMSWEAGKDKITPSWEPLLYSILRWAHSFWNRAILFLMSEGFPLTNFKCSRLYCYIVICLKYLYFNFIFKVYFPGHNILI